MRTRDELRSAPRRPRLTWKALGLTWLFGPPGATLLVVVGAAWLLYQSWNGLDTSGA